MTHPLPFPAPRPWLPALSALLVTAASASGQALTLTQAADAALATHPSVLASQGRLEGAQAGRSAARAAYLPSISGTTGLTRHAEPMVVAPLHGFDPTSPPDFDRTLIQSQLGVDFTLFDGGARRARVRGAEAAEAATELGADATVQDVLEAVTRGYTAVLATRAVADAAQRQEEALASELDRARQRLQEGTAARVEVLRAEAALLDAQAQRASAASSVSLAERGLARLMGAAPGNLAGRPLEDVAPTSSAPDGESAAVGVSTVSGPSAASGSPPPFEDPRVTAARRSLDGAMARLSQEKATRLPTLRASAGLLNFGSGLGEYTTEWQAGVRLSWPLFTGGAREASIRRADADVTVAREELRAMELAMANEMDAADAALAEATARAAALDASVTQWEEVARIEALSLETGAGVQQDFLRAQAAPFQARAGRARAYYDQLLALVGRARAQGRLDRGWMDDALEIRR